MSNNPTIELIEVTEYYFAVTYRVVSNEVLLTYPPRSPSDRVYKDIYEVIDGKIDVNPIRIEGKVTPATTIPEKIEWPDFKLKELK